MPGEEKTEKATPKKRRDAREKEGKVLQSKEIVTAVSILGTFAALAALSSYIFISLTKVVTNGISAVGTEFTNDASTYQNVFLGVIKDCVMIVLPLCVIVSFIVVIGAKRRVNPTIRPNATCPPIFTHPFNPSFFFLKVLI